MLCEPQHGRQVDAMDLLEDVLVEDASQYDIPAPILEAVEQLNQAIAEAGTLSWTEGNVAVTVNEWGSSGEKQS